MKLTKNEVSLLIDITSGKSNKEIANERGITVSTVKNELWRLYLKLRAKNRVQAVVAGLNRGLTSLPAATSQANSTREVMSIW